ncbi:MAG: NifB/NifX family molybdenum-iron cluster-binding protein [Anaerolineales bacterium]|nr:NifB/NifX family molybdenum-iron cluster-binding protein [Anaerolineales bacterium]
MNLVISASTPSFEGQFDQRFGRCPYLILIDADSRDWRAEKNPGCRASTGAGTQAAQFLAQRNVGTVVSGHFGPNAFAALDAADIRMYQAEGGTVESVLDSYLADELKPVQTGGQKASRRRGGRGRGR